MMLSVIIPVYNVQDYLERCLNSVVGHLEKGIEIVLVDDGSTDNSSDICDNYMKQYRNIKVVHQKNGGLSSARNTGIKHASGDYYFFLDSDDMVETSFCDDICKIISNHKPDMISFRWCGEYKSNEFKVSGNKEISISNKYNYYEKIINNQMGSQICFHVYKKEMFDGIMFPLNCHYEDIRIFWKLLGSANKIINVNYTYYIYNLINQKSITKNATLHSMEDMKESIDIMINGIVGVLQQEGRLNSELCRCAEYSKINGYVYIAYKLRNVKSDVSQTKEEVTDYIKSSPVNLWKYRQYDWKRYLVCKALIKVGKL